MKASTFVTFTSHVFKTKYEKGPSGNADVKNFIIPTSVIDVIKK